MAARQRDEVRIGEESLVLGQGGELHQVASGDTPALTTHGRNNHGVRTERWRYIRYADGGEELYDHQADPQEWKNLASDPANAQVIADLRKHLPEKNVEDAPTKGGKGKGKKKKAKAKT